MYKLIPSHENIFDWASKVETLDISHNYLWYIKKNSFGDLPFLRCLNLSNNMFQIIPETLTNFISIVQLDISFNHLTTIQTIVREWISTQIERLGHYDLYLKSNALICSCESADFILWISVSEVNFDNAGNYTCLVRGRGGNDVANYTKNVLEDYNH